MLNHSKALDEYKEAEKSVSAAEKSGSRNTNGGFTNEMLRSEIKKKDVEKKKDKALRYEPF